MGTLEYKHKKTSKIENFFTLAIPSLLVLSELTGNSTIYIAALILTLLMITKPVSIFPSYFVTSLSSTYFSPIDGLGASRVMSLILIISLLLNKDTYEKSKNNRFVFFCFLLILYNLFSSLISVSGSFYTFFIMLQSLLVLLLFTRQRNVNLENLTKMIWWSSVIVLIGLALQAMYSGISIDTTERYVVEDTNENNFAMMCAQLGAAIASYIFLQKALLYRVSSVLLTLICLIIIFISGSRASAIGLFVSTALIPIMLVKGERRRPIRLVILFVLLIVPIIVFYNYAVESDLYLIQRFSMSSIEETGGSGRMDIIKQIVSDILPYYFIFGVGIGGANIMAAGVPKPSHNIIFDPLSQVGIVGVLFYWIFILPIIRNSIKSIKRNKLIVMPLALFLTGLVNGIGETVFWEKFFWNSITLCALYYNTITAHNLINGKIQNAG